MKKLFYMISTVALMASFASCNKIEQGNAPAETPSVDGTTTLTVSAVVPQTKTNLNDGIVRWSAKDVISILAEGKDPVMSEQVASAAETYDFTVNDWYADADPQYAVFTGPYEDYDTYKPSWNDDGAIQMTVRENQVIYNQGSFAKKANISIGELNGNDGVFSTEMKNVCGLLKFTLNNPTKRVVIEDSKGKSMSGAVNVKMVDGVPQATAVSGTEGKITITSSISNTDNTLAHNGTQTYYAVVIPGTYTPKITITPSEGDQIELTAKESITIKRNEWIDLGELDSVTDTGEDEGDSKITLDVVFSAFDPALPTNATTSKNEYKLTVDGKTYSFTLYSPSKGYKYDGSVLRLVGSIEAGDYTGHPGYITLPGVDGYKLTGISITGGNSSGTKTYIIYDKDPIADNVTDENKLTEVEIKQTATSEISLDDSIAGHVYYLCCPGLSGDNNAQMSALELTYTPSN